MTPSNTFLTGWEASQFNWPGDLKIVFCIQIKCAPSWINQKTFEPLKDWPKKFGPLKSMCCVYLNT